MKLYKKVFFFGIIIWSGVIVQAGNYAVLSEPENNNNLWPAIQKVHDKFFYGSNLFEHGLSAIENSQRERSWRKILNSLQNYVENNAKGFLPIAQLIKKTGVTLATAIITGHEQVFSGATGKPKIQRVRAYREVENNIENLLQEKKELANYQMELKKSVFIQVLPFTQVKSLIEKVVNLIEQTIEKTVFDFVKKSRAYGFSPRPALMKEIKIAYPGLLQNTVILMPVNNQRAYLR